MTHDWKHVYISTSIGPEDLSGPVGDYWLRMMEKKVNDSLDVMRRVLMDEPLEVPECEDPWLEREEALVWGE